MALVAAVLIALVVEYWPAFLAITTLAIGAWLLRNTLRRADANLSATLTERRALLSRCDEQHAWVLAGNERGIWGEGTRAVRGYRAAVAERTNDAISTQPAVESTILRA